MLEAAHTNRLIHETSPYLRQHAHNPVDWHAWGGEALRSARERDCPILLSVGYSACHWCHVMERESFENDAIAALMNLHFVCVKVDREERPDIDHVYMSAIQQMTGQGGWPMTVFLTPDGKPFYGGTYYPPDDRYGRPGFPRILAAVAEAWSERRAEVERQGTDMLQSIERDALAGLPPQPVTSEVLSGACRALQSSFDKQYGGFGGAPKFPQPMVLDFLLDCAPRAYRDESSRMAEVTLDRMACGGIYDHLGGGFHRYSTDERWIVPHFEKMLYDNAQLARTYLRAYSLTGKHAYRCVVEESLDYVLREMTSAVGAFYSAQDADSEGEEGRYFVWSAAEIREALGVDANRFIQRYGATEGGNFEGRNILNRSDSSDASDLSDLRKALLERRELRVRPATDDKVLTSWNGLMLAAFAESASTLGRKVYLEAAIRNAEFVMGTLAVRGEKDRRLMRTGRSDGDSFHVAPIPGFLDDYAFYAAGLLSLYEATFDLRWLGLARDLADSILALFADPDGGFYSVADDQADGVVTGAPIRSKEIMDNAIPAGASAACDVLLRLAVLTGDGRYRQPVGDVLRRLAEPMARHPLAFGKLLQVADLFVGPVVELTIIGDPEDAATRALLAAARSTRCGKVVIAAARPDDPAREALPLLAGRAQVDGKATAYVCENSVCKLPATDPDELLRVLS